MNAVKNGVMAACLAYFAVVGVALSSSGNEKPWIVGCVPAVGLLVWSFSGRRKSANKSDTM